MAKFSKLACGLVVILAITLLAIPGSQANAADAPVPKPGITVSPGELNFVLSKDAPNQSIPVTITNEYESVIILGAEFKGIDEDAGLLVPTDNLDKTFAQGLHISETSILIPPHQSKVVQVQADNLATLSPGGHYATLVLTQQDIGGKQVSLKASVSLSVFVVKVAGARQHISVSTFHTDGWLFRLPSKATLSFQNDGNVHAVPRASVSVLDDRYSVLAKGIANQQSLPLLPGKSLTSEVSIAGLTSTWKPQKLLIFTSYRSDGSDDQQVIRRTMWYIPPIYPLIVVVVSGILWFTRAKWWPRLRSRVVRLLPAKLRSMLSARKLRRKVTTAAPASDAPPVISEIVAQSPLAVPAKKRSVRAKPKAKPIEKHKKTTAKKSVTPAKVIAVTDPKPEKPLLTLASLEQRTTRVTPKPKATKRTTKKPKNSPKKATKAASTSKKPKSTD